MADSKRNSKTHDVPLSDGRLMRDVCRHFVPALLALVNRPLAASLDIDNRQILSPEIVDGLREHARFENCLALRLPLTEARYRENIRDALAERKRWEREEREEREECEEREENVEEADLHVSEHEVEEALTDEELLADLNVHRTLIVPFIFLEAREIDDETGEKLFHHSAHFFVEDYVHSLPHAIFLEQGPAGAGLNRWEQSTLDITTLSFQCPAFGLEGARAADWLADVTDPDGAATTAEPAAAEPADADADAAAADADAADADPADTVHTGVRTAAAVFAPWMDARDWSAAETEKRLRAAIADAPVDGDRRHMLTLLLDRKLAPSPAVDREIHRLLHEAPPMSAPNIPCFEVLIDTFYGDLMTIVGRHAVDGLNFQRVVPCADTQWLQDTTDDDLPGTAPFYENVTEIGRRGRETSAIVYLALSRDREEGTDERLARQYMRLRLRFPGQLVIPIALFVGGSTGDHCTICQHADRNGDEMIVRFRYYAFSIAGNNPIDFLADPRPVAWALASMMSSWRWSRGKVVLRSLMKILQAQIDIDTRQALWQFVQGNMSLDKKAKAMIRREMAEHVTVMRETVIEYMNQRLGRFFPDNLREAIAKETDPMKIHHLIEELYEECVEQGLIPRDTVPDGWPVN